MRKITRREHRIIVFLAVLVCLWSLYGFLISPVRTRIETLNRVIPEKIQALDKLKSQTKQYLDLENQFSQIHAKIASQPADFDLMPFLENLTANSRLAPPPMTQQSHDLNDNYTETVVSMELKNITWEQLIQFLLPLNSAQAFINIKSMNIQKNMENPDLLNVSLHIAHIKKTI
ncbi:MAG: type II secretion system protein M [Sedimentisphaerales bacterium]|nr:type II secretion system protein M [Sedimentisphaerales bacterium]